MDAGLMRREPVSEGLYYHDLNVTLSETMLITAVGLTRNAGLEWWAPLRTVTTRVRFVDAERRPFVSEEADLHHRNETRAGPGDPWLLLHLARTGGAWTVAPRLGVTIPLGHTEGDPFDLGRRGLAHQHVQLGTGTWDPVLGLAAGRRLGEVGLSVSTLARLTAYENEPGYRAGNRYQAALNLDRGLGAVWRVTSGLELAREDAERWQGLHDEEEGNLGRTDLRLAFGLVRSIRGVGGLSLSVRIPLVTRARGAQLDYPALVSVGLAR